MPVPIKSGIRPRFVNAW